MSELTVGQVLGGYRLDELAGRGGMGVVYRATQVRLERVVALKVIAPELASDPAFRERFQREARLLASVDDPHVVPVYEADEADGQLFLSMRWIDGGDLAGQIARTGGLELMRAQRLLAQVASGLDAVHAHGLVHGDLKPANMLIERRGAGEGAYLSDFGAGRSLEATATGNWLGTVDYVAPEVIRGAPPDPRSDRYGLACVLFEALTGAPPFHRDTEWATMWAHYSDPVPSACERRPALPRAVDAVLARGLAKDPDERYASGERLIQALSDALLTAGGQPTGPLPRTNEEQAAEPAPIPAGDPSDDGKAAPVPAPPPAKTAGDRWRRALALAGLALVAGAIAASAAALTSSGHSPDPHPSQADRQLAEKASLRLSDFPAGWQQYGALAQGFVCPLAKDVQATAKSLNFVSTSGEAYNVTRVYRSVADAEHAFAGLSSAARRTCVAKDGTAMSIGEIGDERTAFRSIVTNTSQGLTNYLTSDLRIVRVNRSVVVLSFVIYRNGPGIRLRSKPTANAALESKLTTALVDRLEVGLSAEPDTQIAEKSSLRLSDFPTGWEQKNNTGLAGRSACAVENAKHAADATASSEFESTHVSFDEVGGYENVYRSVAEAERVFAKLTSQANRSCIANFTAHMIPPSQTVTLGNVTTSQVSIGEIGDQRAAWRLTVPLNTNALTVDSIADYRFVRVGRGIAYLLFTAGLKPIDEVLQAKLTTAVVDRLKAGLAAGS